MSVATAVRVGTDMSREGAAVFGVPIPTVELQAHCTKRTVLFVAAVLPSRSRRTPSVSGHFPRASPTVQNRGFVAKTPIAHNSRYGPDCSRMSTAIGARRCVLCVSRFLVDGATSDQLGCLLW